MPYGANRRKFNGKVYTLYTWNARKQDALYNAREQRELGKLVRLISIHVAGIATPSGYLIYTRKK